MRFPTICCNTSVKNIVTNIITKKQSILIAFFVEIFVLNFTTLFRLVFTS